LRHGGAVVSACELAGARAAMAAWFFHLGLERARERGRDGSEGDYGVMVL
jgi:hypothetical protein